MTSKQLKEQARRYARVVQWSDKDQCFIGSCPNFPAITERGTDEVKVYRELCRKVETWIEHLDIVSLPEPLPPKFRPDLELVKRQATEAIRELEAQILSEDSSEDRSGSAAWSFHRLTVQCVDSLYKLVRAKPVLFRSIARTSVAWPAFISRHGSFGESQREFMERLDLGAGHFFKVAFEAGKRGKRWSVTTPANIYASQMFITLVEYQAACRALARDSNDEEHQEMLRRNGFEATKPFIVQTEELTRRILALPTLTRPLTRDVVEECFDLSWELLLAKTHRPPELIPELAALGSHRKWHTETSTPGSKTEASNIRDGIKRRLALAFLEVTGTVPKGETATPPPD